MENSAAHKQTSLSPFSVIVVFLALMVIGVAFVPLPVVRFKPERNLPQLSVRFSWPNASPFCRNMLPFLFQKGMDAELQKPPGLAIIGGMLVGTVVSLYLIPLMYYLLRRE